MNILTDRLPETVTVGASQLEINTDFRAGVAFELMVEKGETNVYRLLYPFFPDGFPDDLDFEAVLEPVLWFYRCGDKSEQKGTGQTNNKQAYSFGVDGATIYADFWRFYGLDLSAMYLHWWAFRALLTGLPDDSGYKQRVYYRTCDLKGLPKKEQARINEIRKLIAINPDQRGKVTLEERNAQMLAYVSKRSNEASNTEIKG